MKLKQLYPLLLLTFILGVKDGSIALWKKGEAEPVHVFPYRAETLPPEAREALREGIPIRSVAELEALAEAYLS